MTRKDRLYEKSNYLIKCAYARLVGQWPTFKGAVAAAGRSDWPEYAKINLSSLRPEGGPLSISAVMRVRDAESSLVLSVESIVHFCREVILVDHMSRDRTWVLMQELAEKYPGRVKAYRYEKPAARAGMGYLERVHTGEGSLAEYYNFCFSLGTEAYLLKWDADMLAIPSFYGWFKKAIEKDADIVYFDGIDAMGVYSCTNEGRLFKRSLNWQFRDYPYCEGLMIGGHELTKAKLKRYNVPVPNYFHLRQLV